MLERVSCALGLSVKNTEYPKPSLQEVVTPSAKWSPETRGVRSSFIPSPDLLDVTIPSPLFHYVGQTYNRSSNHAEVRASVTYRISGIPLLKQSLPPDCSRAGN